MKRRNQQLSSLIHHIQPIRIKSIFKFMTNFRVIMPNYLLNPELYVKILCTHAALHC